LQLQVQHLARRWNYWEKPDRLNNKYGVRSPKFVWATVNGCTHWLRPHNFPIPPAFGLMYEGAICQPIETTSLCNPLRKTVVLRLAC
jgi:hypothetical protein